MEEKRARENSPSNSAVSAEDVQSQAVDSASSDLGNPSRSDLAELVKRLAAPPQPIIIYGDNPHLHFNSGLSQPPGNTESLSNINPSHNSTQNESTLAIPGGTLVSSTMFLLPGNKLGKSHQNMAFWANSSSQLVTTRTKTIQNKLFDYVTLLVDRLNGGLPRLTINGKVPVEYLNLLRNDDPNSKRFCGNCYGHNDHDNRYRLHKEINDLFGFELISIVNDKITLFPLFHYEVHTSPTGYPEIARSQKM
jgi:hypothetical protein